MGHSHGETITPKGAEVGVWEAGSGHLKGVSLFCVAQ